MLFFKVQ